MYNTFEPVGVRIKFTKKVWRIDFLYGTRKNVTSRGKVGEKKEDLGTKRRSTVQGR